MKDDHAAVRVRRRLRAWAKEYGYGSRVKLAHAVNSLYGEKKSVSWAADVLRDGPGEKIRDVRLRDLDALAELLHMPPGELVAHDGNHYIEARPSELKLVRYYRSLPVVIQQHMMAYLDFLFAAHEREQVNIEQQRRAHTEETKRKGIA